MKLLVAGYWQLVVKSLKWLSIGIALSSTLVSDPFSALSQAKHPFANLCRKIIKLMQHQKAALVFINFCKSYEQLAIFNDINFCHSFKAASTKRVTELQSLRLSLGLISKRFQKLIASIYRSMKRFKSGQTGLQSTMFCVPFLALRNMIKHPYTSCYMELLVLRFCFLLRHQ